MTQLTTHFSLEELLATKHKIDNTPNEEQLQNLHRLAVVLEQVRTSCGNYPIDVSSGFRSAAINSLVGGSNTSAHSLGLAADFTVAGQDIKRTFNLIWHSNIAFDQLILEPTWIHLGLSVSNMRRQGLRTTDRKTYSFYAGD